MMAPLENQCPVLTLALLAQNEVFFTLSAHFIPHIVELALVTRWESLLKTTKKTSASTP
jgi:hypothetical protein